MKRNTVLIIHLGPSGRQDAKTTIPAFRHVISATSLLEGFKGQDVTWITSRQAAPLLQGNHLIDHLLVCRGSRSVPPLPHEQYHTVINLESSPGWGAFTQAVWARHRFSPFYWEGGAVMAHPSSWDPPSLFRLLGREWKGQGYSLGYQPDTTCQAEVGLDVGGFCEFPAIRWSSRYWQRLAERLQTRYRISRSASESELLPYLDWIASCKFVITANVLGLLAALALKKQVLALLTRCEYDHVFLFGQGVKFAGPDSVNCPGCLSTGSDLPHLCLNGVTPEIVEEAADCLLKGLQTPSPNGTLLPQTSPVVARV